MEGGPIAGQFEKVKLLHPGGAPPPGATHCKYSNSGGSYPSIWGQSADDTPHRIAGFNVSSRAKQTTVTTFDAKTCINLGGCSVSFGGAAMTVKGGNNAVPGHPPCTTLLTFYGATF